MIVEKDFETVQSMSKGCALSEHTIRRLLNNGVIKGKKIGLVWFIANEEAERVIAENPIDQSRGAI